MGPALGRVLNQRGISTVGDLLFFFPRAYEDRRHFTRIADLADGSTATFAATVRSVRWIPSPRPRLHVVVGDESGSIELVWFHARRGQDREFRAGRQLLVTGQVRSFGSRQSVTHPEITWDAGPSEQRHAGRVVPIYTELEGISSRIWRNILANALERYARDIHEVLPPRLIEHYRLMPRAQAVRLLHFPEGDPEPYASFQSPAQKRMIFEEFFLFAKAVQTSRRERRKQSPVILEVTRAGHTLQELTARLPFELTGDQQRAIAFCQQKIQGREVLNLLLQGDVGSGKTLVALLSAATLVDQGFQVALLAPTEILVRQHLKTAVSFFGSRIPLSISVGSQNRAERDELRRQLTHPTLVIGTHALLEPDVQFSNLALVIIDEQHRFGVDQRRTLRAKGTLPHLIAMSATPIPRSLALAVYGDLESLQIREKPKGRLPIQTRVIRRSGQERVWAEVAATLASGQQGYLLSPFVQDSEAEGFEDVASAERSLAEARARCPALRIEMLHGKIAPEEKNAILRRFSAGEIDLLVCTTVVEVGIDVPNATLMIIQNADRFGLAALHQLRGRVGRGSRASKCFLFLSGERAGESAEARLDILETSQDGFEIAEADLRLRGPGHLVGTAQAGLLAFRIGDVVRDEKILEAAHRAAHAEHLDEEPYRVAQDTVALGAARHQS